MKHIQLFEEFVVEINEAAVKQFDKDYADMVKNIKSGYGWIDPEYVADTWENSSDSIDFELVKVELYKRLLKAGLLWYGDEEKETQVKSLKELGIKESVNTSESFLKFGIDVKYWSNYNKDTSGQGEREHEVKSKDFEDTFEDAVVYWNQEADGAENRIKGAQIQKIKKMAQEFYKKAGWISVNVIHAMISQEV